MRARHVKGKRARAPGYMYMPETCKQYDDDGTEMVVCLVTPLWGETEAGFEWDLELHECLLEMGWRQCAGVPAMYYFNSEDGDCRLVKVVDDLGFSESSSEQPITKATIATLKERYGKLTADLNATSFVGYKVESTKDEAGVRRVTLSQETKIVAAVRKYLPELLQGDASSYISGKRLEEQLEMLELPEERTAKLNPEQKRVQQIIGDLKYFERGSCPRLSRKVHRLSCIMGFPPSGALQCAQGVLAEAYENRKDGITYTSASMIADRRRDGELGQHDEAAHADEERQWQEVC